MQMAQFTPSVIAYAVLGGILPTFLWLYFWTKQASGHEPRGLIALSFIIGAIVVPITIPVQHIANDYFGRWEWFVFIAAGIEELLKFLVMRMVVMRSDLIKQPADYTTYMIAAALGFAALENSLYMLKPLLANNIELAINTGNMRFLGSTVIHAVSSASFGLWVGLSYCSNGFNRLISAVIGLATAITLHGIFNYFIMDSSKTVVTTTIIVAWVAMLGIVAALQQASRVRTCPVD